MPAVIYYDFTSAESFVLNELVATLPNAAEISWRGVQVDPSLASPMVPFDRRTRERMEMDVSDARKAAPEVKLNVARGVPNTRIALQAVASVERMHAIRADGFRRALFREYWHVGGDISDRAVVRRVATDAHVPPWVELEHQAAQATQVSWELEWRTERLGGVPRAIRSDGQILWTVKAEADVRAFLSPA